ncbi:zinc ribbon domain-containing protein [Sedimentibacter sp.]|uniref:zinc ribbon domain-containing protein n=1 Tax=Sedimentibacter sp. TaxID=1960295 RepID=UPI0028A14BBE|nr:zinc ribbon domain-containing protein [Sedimentibacter sp.]
MVEINKTNKKLSDGRGKYMFFIAGITHERKELDYYEPILCRCCTKYGRFESYMEYSVFSLFFIPLFKFNKKFYAKTSCCNSLYLIKNKEKGLMMERGQGYNVFLKDKDLELIHRGACVSLCTNCGYEVSDEHNYCPNCGKSL